MIEVPINFRQAYDIVNFVEKINEFSCNADLVSGNRMVDAKSLMGALAISQAQHLRLVLHENSQNEANEILSIINEYTFK